MSVIDKYDFLVMGLLRSKLETVHATASEIIEQHFPPSQFEIRQLPLDISLVYERRPPSGGAHLKRAVFFEPGSVPNTTVLIANMEDGWITLFGSLAARISGQHLLVRSSINDEYPVTDFEVWEDGVSVRYVGALREDPAWEFSTRGRPLSFEAPSNYQLKAVSRRLTRSILLEYTEANGWNLTSSAFWDSKLPAVYLIEQTQPPSRN